MKRLPQKLRTQYFQRALDTDSTPKSDDLLTYLTRSVRAAEHNAEDLVETIDTLK